MALPTIFNCSNDIALAANVRQYFPPKRIQQMEEELHELGRCWDSGPWGWSLSTRQRYLKMGVSEEELPSEEWLNEVRRLSSREYACRYIQEMLASLNKPSLVGHEMVFRTEVGDVKADAPHIYKSPWSSSGRGVFTSVNMSKELIGKKLQGFINTQGGYVEDRFYEKELDFAMEFWVNEDHSVKFLGYSVFHAEESGAYGYNLVESQEELKKMINIDEQLLQCLINYHVAHLGVSAYKGPVGIDMLKCKDGSIHPCIEINLRMNMGILAILLYDKYGSNANVQLTPRREKGFEAKIENGKLMIVFHN